MKMNVRHGTCHTCRMQRSCMCLRRRGSACHKLYRYDRYGHWTARHFGFQTGVLNEIMMEAVAMQQPPSDKGKTSEALLYHPGIGKTTDLCNFCK